MHQKREITFSALELALNNKVGVGYVNIIASVMYHNW